MGEEFYAILKLVSGEEIFSLIVVDNENDDDTVIVLQNPVLMWSVSNPNGTFIKVKPWLELPDEDIFMIRLDKVITMTECKDQKLIKIYKQYIEEKDADDIQVIKQRSEKGKINWPGDPKLGYISSVEKKRESLEKLFKSDSKES